MQLENLLIGIILVSMFAVGIGGFYVSVASEYGQTVDPKYQNTFNKFNQSYSIAEDLTNDVKGGSVEQGSTNSYTVDNLLKAGTNAIKLVLVQGLPVALAMMGSITEFVPLPSFIVAGIQAILIILVVFALVYLFFRFKPQ